LKLQQHRCSWPWHPLQRRSSRLPWMPRRLPLTSAPRAPCAGSPPSTSSSSWLSGNCWHAAGCGSRQDSGSSPGLAGCPAGLDPLRVDRRSAEGARHLPAALPASRSARAQHGRCTLTLLVPTPHRLSLCRAEARLDFGARSRRNGARVSQVPLSRVALSRVFRIGCCPVNFWMCHVYVSVHISHMVP